MSLADYLDQLDAEQDDFEKIAAEEDAAGRIMARGFMDELDKLAQPKHQAGPALKSIAHEAERKWYKKNPMKGLISHPKGLTLSGKAQEVEPMFLRSGSVKGGGPSAAGKGLAHQRAIRGKGEIKSIPFKTKIDMSGLSTAAHKLRQKMNTK